MKNKQLPPFSVYSLRATGDIPDPLSFIKSHWGMPGGRWTFLFCRPLWHWYLRIRSDFSSWNLPKGHYAKLGARGFTAKHQSSPGCLFQERTDIAHERRGTLRPRGMGGRRPGLEGYSSLAYIQTHCCAFSPFETGFKKLKIKTNWRNLTLFAPWYG